MKAFHGLGPILWPGLQSIEPMSSYGSRVSLAAVRIMGGRLGPWSRGQKSKFFRALTSFTTYRALEPDCPLTDRLAILLHSLQNRSWSLQYGDDPTETGVQTSQEE